MPVTKMSDAHCPLNIVTSSAYTSLRGPSTLQLPDPSRTLRAHFIPPPRLRSLLPGTPVSLPRLAVPALGDQPPMVHSLRSLYAPASPLGPWRAHEAFPRGSLPFCLSLSSSIYLRKKSKPWLFKEYCYYFQKILLRNSNVSPCLCLRRG